MNQTLPRYFPGRLNQGDRYWYVIDRTTGQPVVYVTHTKRQAQHLADERNEDGR